MRASDRLCWVCRATSLNFATGSNGAGRPLLPLAIAQPLDQTSPEIPKVDRPLQYLKRIPVRRVGKKYLTDVCAGLFSPAPAINDNVGMSDDGQPDVPSFSIHLHAGLRSAPQQSTKPPL